ncbi:MAG: hypothetical protein JW709_04270 [Sedimentisphaerales bacterium]|nr:hypothetical protein [Sedimentisphaerales bacterium]
MNDKPDAMKQRKYIEMDENGFRLKYDTGLFGWNRIRKDIRWDDIVSIKVYMMDSIFGHTIGLQFYDESDKYLGHVSEDIRGYDDLKKLLKTKFSGFNSHNMEEIELMFPSDISFPCWNREKPVGDLVVNKQECRILWNDTQDVFLEWKNKD